MKIFLGALLLLLATLVAIEWHREWTIERAYAKQQQDCIAYAKTQFPHGEVDPVTWCQP